jgi:hypothetical protein
MAEATLPNLDWIRMAYQDSWSGRGNGVGWIISNPEFPPLSAEGTMTLRIPKYFAQATAIRAPMAGVTPEDPITTRIQRYVKCYTQVVIQDGKG